MSIIEHSMTATICFLVLDRSPRANLSALASPSEYLTMPMSKWASIADRLRTVYSHFCPSKNCLHEMINLLGQSSRATYANGFSGRTHARKSSVRKRKIVRVFMVPSIPSVNTIEPRC